MQIDKIQKIDTFWTYICLATSQVLLVLYWLTKVITEKPWRAVWLGRRTLPQCEVASKDPHPKVVAKRDPSWASKLQKNGVFSVYWWHMYGSRMVLWLSLLNSGLTCWKFSCTGGAEAEMPIRRRQHKQLNSTPHSFFYFGSGHTELRPRLKALYESTVWSRRIEVGNTQDVDLNCVWIHEQFECVS